MYLLALVTVAPTFEARAALFVAGVVCLVAAAVRIGRKRP